MALPHDPRIVGTIHILPPSHASRRAVVGSDQTLAELLCTLAHEPRVMPPSPRSRLDQPLADAAACLDPLPPGPPLVLADLRRLKADLRREFARLSRGSHQH
jgi:hypothetical protein